MTLLDEVDLTQTVDRKTYNKKVKALQIRMRELQFTTLENKIPVVLAFEGWDAAGKGGAIKRLTELLDPRFFVIVPIAAPRGAEKTHHYLWRFWTQLPPAGEWAVFDRTWYGRVLVERVEGFCSEEDWRRALDHEINEFEQSLVNYGTVVLKFWVHISQQEQLDRFNGRKSDKYKNWKLTDEDWRNRDRWNIYEESVNDMLLHTNTNIAPWQVVPGNDKLFARLFVLERTIEAVEARIDNFDPLKYIRKGKLHFMFEG